MLADSNRILIIRLSSLGDVLLTTPVIRAIKKKNAGIRIDFLVKPQYQEALKFNPYLNEIYTYGTKEKNKALFAELKKNNYDYVIDLHNNLRTRIVRIKLGGRRLVFRKPHIKKLFLVKFKINLYKNIASIPELYSRTIKGLVLDEKGLDIFPEKGNAEDSGENVLYAGFCPGSRHFTKMWPTDYFAELGLRLSELGYKIILFGGSDDRNICGELNNRIPGSIDSSNDNELLKTASEMRKCRFIVCNDSGLMHLASALKIPLISIFGSTVKEFGFGPYRCRHLILENNLLNCRPCSHIGRSECPKRHFKCMAEIDPHYVAAEIRKFLEAE